MRILFQMFCKLKSKLHFFARKLLHIFVAFCLKDWLMSLILYYQQGKNWDFYSCKFILTISGQWDRGEFGDFWRKLVFSVALLFQITPSHIIEQFCEVNSGKMLALLSIHLILSACHLIYVPITLLKFLYQTQLMTLFWVFTLHSPKLYHFNIPFSRAIQSF